MSVGITLCDHIACRDVWAIRFGNSRYCFRPKMFKYCMLYEKDMQCSQDTLKVTAKNIASLGYILTLDTY